MSFLQGDVLLQVHEPTADLSPSVRYAARLSLLGKIGGEKRNRLRILGVSKISHRKSATLSEHVGGQPRGETVLKGHVNVQKVDEEDSKAGLKESINQKVYESLWPFRYDIVGGLWDALGKESFLQENEGQLVSWCELGWNKDLQLVPCRLRSVIWSLWSVYTSNLSVCWLVGLFVCLFFEAERQKRRHLDTSLRMRTISQLGSPGSTAKDNGFGGSTRIEQNPFGGAKGHFFAYFSWPIAIQVDLRASHPFNWIVLLRNNNWEG